MEKRSAALRGMNAVEKRSAALRGVAFVKEWSEAPRGVAAAEDLSAALQGELLAGIDLEQEISDDEILGKIDELLLSGDRARILTVREKERLRRDLFFAVRRLDVLQELIDDPGVTEIMVNGPEKIFVEKEGRIRLWHKHFSSRQKLEDVIQKIVGRCNRSVNEGSPIVDARLENGARVNVVLRPAALNGPILTIRRFPDTPITMEHLVRTDCISEEAAKFLKTLVEARYSMVIGGATSTGKTTFLNALSHAIPADERIITIEDNAELQIQGVQNLVRLEAKEAVLAGGAEVTIRDLIKSALRMRPDRIILGEVRGGEAFDLLQAFNTGHEGSLTTAHANSAADMLSRLETMVLMGMELPLPAIRGQIASGVEVLIHLARGRDKKRRVMEIAEVEGICQGEIVLRNLFERDTEGRLVQKNGLLHTEKKIRRGTSQGRKRR